MPVPHSQPRTRHYGNLVGICDRYQGDSALCHLCMPTFPLREYRQRWESGKGMRLTEHICNVSQFLCRFRVQLRLTGELTRSFEAAPP